MAKLKLNIPVKKGDRLELDVETLASSGDGLCRYEGYTLFTPGGLPGDKIVGKVVKTTPRFGVMKMSVMCLNWQEPSSTTGRVIRIICRVTPWLCCFRKPRPVLAYRSKPA